MEASSGRPVKLDVSGQQGSFMAEAGKSYVLSVRNKEMDRDRDQARDDANQEGISWKIFP
jgi:hypothetical protein